MTEAQQLGEQFFGAALEALDKLGTIEHRREGPPARLPDTAWREAGASDWFRIAAPEDAGGLGLGLTELGAVARAAGRRLFTGPLAEHATAVPALLCGRPRWAGVLDAALAGTTLVAYVEPVPAPWGGRPPRLRDGRLCGAVDLVPFAPFAEHLLVQADGQSGPAVVIIPANAAQVEAVGVLDPTMTYGRVEFFDVPVEADQVLVNGPAASDVIEQLLSTRRLLLAAEQAGVAAELVERAVAYAKTRQQFGRPIGGFQAIRHILAEMQGRLSGLESFVTTSLAEADAHPDRRHRLGAAAKVLSASAVRYIGAQSLQVHGAIGFTTELPLHLFLLRAITGEKLLGTPEGTALDLGRMELAR